MLLWGVYQQPSVFNATVNKMPSIQFTVKKPQRLTDYSHLY